MLGLKRGDAQFIRAARQNTPVLFPKNMSEFINENLSLMEDSYLSDFFGDLSYLRGIYKNFI